MSSEEITYFFSYARKDSEFVLKLAKELRAVGVNLWLDQLDIFGGQRWDRAVEGALETCRGMIIVLSPESLVSNNVMDEVSYALEEGKLVVPILLRSCAIPFRLRRLHYIEFTAGYDTGFSQLLRTLRIDQPWQPLEPATSAKPIWMAIVLTTIGWIIAGALSGTLIAVGVDASRAFRKSMLS